MKTASARRSFARLPRERRVTDILAAARAQFCQNGYENTAMAAIAERAGVVEGTIYKYFSTKRDLLVQVLASWYQAMLEDYQDELSTITGVPNRLRYVIWRHLKSIAEEPELCRLFFREIRGHDDYTQSPLYRLNRAYTDFAIAVLKEGTLTGELRSDLPVPLVRDLIYGTIEHTTWRYVTLGGELPVERLAGDLTGLVLAAAKAQAPLPDLAGVAERLDGIARRIEADLDRGARP